MSRVLQPTNPTQAPVLPGTQVTTQLQMSTAINAGDYVYLTSSGYGVATTNPTYGSVTIPWNGSTATGYVQAGGTLAATQYGPVYSSTTYSGTTYTLGQVALTPTVLNSLSSASNFSGVTALTNGNFVYVYRTASGTYVFRIINQTGTTVAGPTTIASNITTANATGQTIAICPLAAGGFIICYASSSGTGLFVQKYTSAGATSGSLSNIPAGGSASSSYYFVNVVETSNGNLGFFYVYSNTGNYTITDSSFNIVKANSSVDGYASGYANAIFTGNCLVATALASGNFVCVWYDNSYGWRSGFYSTSGAWLSSNYSSSPSIGISSSYARAVSICPTGTGDQYFLVGQTGSVLLAARMVPNTGYTGYSFQYTSTVDALAGASGFNTNIFACSSDTYGVFYVTNSSLPHVCFTSSASTTTVPAWGTPVALNGSTAVAQSSMTNCFVASPNGRAAWCINPASTYYPSAVNVASYAVTNGQTLVGTSYSPTNYYLQGVSLDTVSAGQTANIVINGSATLNNNYPSLASTTNFDYSGTGQFGNVGSVYGRTVTLKGAQ